MNNTKAVKTTKVANYSVEQVATIRSMYTGKDNTAEVKAIASALGKSAASVRAKLASEGVYVKAIAAKTGRGTSSKTKIAENIGNLANLSDAEVEGLAKATKGSLEKVLAQLTNV
jgi:hypothetical protein